MKSKNVEIANTIAAKLMEDFSASLKESEEQAVRLSRPLTEEARRDIILGFVRGCLKASEEAGRLYGHTWIDFVSLAGCMSHGARTHVTEAETKLHIFLHLIAVAFPDGDFPAPDMTVIPLGLNGMPPELQELLQGHKVNKDTSGFN